MDTPTPQWLKDVDAYAGDTHVSALVLNVLRDVNRQLATGATLTHENLIKIGAYTRGRAIKAKLTDAQQRMVVESVLRSLVEAL